MRNRILILLAAFSLLLAAPLLAQTEEPETMDEPQVEQTAELQADAEDGTATASAELTATTSEPNEVEGEMESDVQAEANAEVGISSDEDPELPQTAGFLPLLALLGLGSLASALGLRAVRK